MFSFLNPYSAIKVIDPCLSMPRPTEIFHATVDSPKYISRGVDRSLQYHCIFHYTVQGSGEVLYNRRSYRTQAGQGFFNIINDPLSGYGYPKDGDQPWEFIVICFDGGNTRALTHELLQRQVIYDLNGRCESFRRLCLDLSKPLLDRETGLSAIFRLFSMLEPPQEIGTYATQFRQIAERDVMLHPTILAISREIGISREHLQREFLRSTGISPAKYLEKLRLSKLCQLLQENYREAEITEIMHFPSVSSLCLFFKRCTGMTPSKYREQKYLDL